MKLNNLLLEWEKKAKEERTAHEYMVRLPVSVAARVCALKEMYPGRSESEIMVGLLSSALDELLETLPYVQGEMTREDEFGDPIYGDAGLTPRFIQLTQKYTRMLEAGQREDG